ncbi:unnamed protein product, partial [Prorocentrum cordatum]
MRRRRRRRKRGRAGSPHPGRPEAPRVCTRAELIPPQRAPATLLSRCAAAWPRSRLSVAAAGSGGSSLGLGDLAAGLPVALAHGGEAGGGQPGGEADGLGEPDLGDGWMRLCSLRIPCLRGPVGVVPHDGALLAARLAPSSPGHPLEGPGGLHGRLELL